MFWWVFGRLKGFQSIVQLEIANRTAQLFYILFQMYSNLITLAICCHFLQEMHCVVVVVVSLFVLWPSAPTARKYVSNITF